MRILLAATRRIHTLAVSLHIAALRVGVWFSDREVAVAIEAVDTAQVIREAAAKAFYVATSLEERALRSNHTYRMAAQAEATSLRRGVFL